MAAPSERTRDIQQDCLFLTQNSQDSKVSALRSIALPRGKGVPRSGTSSGVNDKAYSLCRSLRQSVLCSHGEGSLIPQSDI